jgi:hypothetical protein
MVQAPQRSALSGPTLIRVLARLSDTDVPAPGQSLSDRLSQWLGWTDAITLSTALSASPPVVAGLRADDDPARLCEQVRTSLARAVAGVGPAGAGRDRASRVRDAAAAATTAGAGADYADFRQRYLSLQQTMQTDVGQLRGRLRRMLAARTSDLARLALLDATMEQALAARERNLLAAIPTLLGAHFERLREAERQRLADAESSEESVASQQPQQSQQPPQSKDAPSITPGAWLHTFRHDMRSVLLAELEVRFQPVEGLLAALRAS